MIKRVLCLLITAVILMSPVTARAADDDLVATLQARITELQQQLQAAQGGSDELSAMIADLQRQLEEAQKPPAKALTPKIKLQSPSQAIILKNTNSHTASLTLKNIGQGRAENVLVQADSPQGAPLVASITGANLIRYISRDGTASASLKIDIDKDAESGTYGIPLKYTYFDQDGAELNDTDTVYVKIDLPAIDGESYVVIDDFLNNKTEINPGDSFTIEAALKNAGATQARNAQLTIEGLAADGIFLESSTSGAFYPLLRENAREKAAFNLKAADKAKGGTYPLTFKLTWLNEKAEQKEGAYTYYAVINHTETPNAAPIIKTGEIIPPPGNIYPGGTFTVTLPVINASDKEITVTIAADAGEEGAVVPKSADKLVINSLSPGEVREIDFSFMATSKSVTRNYAIGFNLSYDEGEGEDKKTHSFSQYVGVNVINPDADKKEDEEDEKKSVPKIIISRYEADPIVVKAGENFDLTIAFLNTHAEKTIKNIKAYLTSVNETGENKKGSVFTPVNASNTFYIDEITPKNETEMSMTFYTVPDAEPRNYIININFEYEDADGTEYKATEEFGINVKQITKIDTGDINIPPDGFIGQSVPVYFDFYNTGKVTLSNLTIRIEGEFDTSVTSSYYSNFAPGAYDSYDMSFTPNEAGAKTGRIVITYQDEAGEEVNVYKDFSMNVMDMGGGMEMMGPDFMGGMQDDRPSGGGFFTSPVFIISAIAAVIVVIVVIILLVRRARRRRKEMESDE